MTYLTRSSLIYSHSVSTPPSSLSNKPFFNKMLNNERVISFIEEYLKNLESAKKVKRGRFSAENTELVRSLLDSIATTKNIAYRRQISSSLFKRSTLFANFFRF
jgi:hypothetical protein